MLFIFWKSFKNIKCLTLYLVNTKIWVFVLIVGQIGNWKINRALKFSKYLYYLEVQRTVIWLNYYLIILNQRINYLCLNNKTLIRWCCMMFNTSMSQFYYCPIRWNHTIPKARYNTRFQVDLYIILFLIIIFINYNNYQRYNTIIMVSI